MVARRSEEPLEHLDSDSIRRLSVSVLRRAMGFCRFLVSNWGLTKPLYPNEIIHLLASFR